MRSLLPGFGYDVIGNAITVWDDYIEIEDRFYPYGAMVSIEIRVLEDIYTMQGIPIEVIREYKIKFEMKGGSIHIFHTRDEALADAISAAYTLYKL